MVALRLGVIGSLAGGLAVSTVDATHAKNAYEVHNSNCQTATGACVNVPADLDFNNCVKQSGETAIAACTRSITSGRYGGGNLAMLHNNRGIEYSAKGDFDRAIADYDQSIKIDPKSALTYNNRGQAYAAKRDFDRAIADYSAAIKIEPLPKSATYINVYDNRGQAYAAKGDFNRAIADYSEAIKIDPAFPLAYNNRGIAYRAEGDYDRAIADYGEAIRLAPSNALGYNNRGEAYAAKGDFDHAIADYSQAIRIDPLPQSVIHINAYDNRGQAHAARGDYDHAIADYDEAIRIDPKYALAYKNRGDAFAANRDYDRAIDDYSQAIQIDPKYTVAYFYRGIAELYSGAPPKALADLDLTTELAPQDPYAALWLDIVDKRNSLPSHLSRATSKLDMTKWPAPVIRLYLGQMTPDAVLAAADNPKPETKKAQLCEANFFIGQQALQQGGKDQAVRLFRLAASTCPRDYIQFDAAIAELKALGADPQSPVDERDAVSKR